MAVLDVSVVMIFRDPPTAFFDEAIDSVLAQTGVALELLLCDDGSGPAAAHQASTRAAREPDRIRLLHHPGGVNLGMSASRNLGLAGALGEHVAFLDADDVWTPGHLAEELALLRRHPTAGAVCGRALDWYSWDDPECRDRWSPLPYPPGTLVPPPGLLEAVLRRGAYSTPTCSLLVRRSAALAVGGADPAFTGMYEDQVLLARLYLGLSCVVSGSRTARYRRHPGSASAQAERDGSYHPWHGNPSRTAYLRWLAEQPGVAGAVPAHPGVAAMVGAELARSDDTGTPVRKPAHQARGRLVDAARRLSPAPVRRTVRRLRNRADRLRPPLRRIGEVPFSRQFGYDRGQPIDRAYIEAFLAENAHLIGGDVLEVGDDGYTRMFGGPRVRRSAVLNIDPEIPGTTIAADLADAPQIPSESFDCLIVTQTLQLVWDLPAAARTLRRVLRPGGTLLLTVPGISPVSDDRWAETWYWSLTPHAARRLFDPVFDSEVEVRSWGNLESSVGFLAGLAAHELRPDQLSRTDEQFPMLVSVLASRPVAP